jgi:hypothetical protein
MHGFLNEYAKAVFDAEEVKILTEAFDAAWATLVASKAPFSEADYSWAGRTIVQSTSSAPPQTVSATINGWSMVRFSTFRARN